MGCTITPQHLLFNRNAIFQLLKVPRSTSKYLKVSQSISNNLQVPGAVLGESFKCFPAAKVTKVTKVTKVIVFPTAKVIVLERCVHVSEEGVQIQWRGCGFSVGAERVRLQRYKGPPAGSREGGRHPAALLLPPHPQARGPSTVSGTLNPLWDRLDDAHRGRTL
eukprot:37228-Prorocentrum_minimum.AAC.3